MPESQQSIRYQIPALTSLDEQTRLDIGKRVKDDLTSMQNDREDWLDRQERFLWQWNDYITPNREGTWNHSANFHVPFTMQQCRGFHARMMGILFEVYPWFYLVPTDPADNRKRRFLETLMQWSLERHMNHNAGIYPAIDRWMWDCVTTGRGVLKLRYEEQVERFIDVEDEIIDQIVNGQIQQVKTGNQYEIEKEETVYSGVIAENVDILDFYMPGGVTVETSPLIVQRLHKTEDELQRLKQVNMFFPDALDRLLEKRPSQYNTTDRETNIAQERDELEGVEVENSDLGAYRPKYRILEWWGSWDINGDGIEEKVVCWVDEQWGELLGWNYTHRVCKSSRPPFYVCEFIPRQNMPMGMVELLYPINQEIDSLHNMRIDAGTIMNVPWGTVKESRTLKSDDIMIQPGYFIPVDEHDDIQIKVMPNTGAFFLQEEQLAINHGEKLGMSSLGFGQTPDKVGALGTATGTQSMLNEMNRVLAVHLQRVRQAWKELLKGIYQLLKERLPLGTAFRVTGEDGQEAFGRLENRQWFAANVDFHFVANSTALNKELEKQNAIMWQQMAQNPIWIQFGLSNPATLQASAKDLARMLGKQNIADYVAEPQVAPRPQTLEEEVSFIAQGINPVIVPNDDHAAKIQGLTMYRDGDDMKIHQQNNPELYRRLFAGFNNAINQHQQLLQVIQAQAAQSNVSGIEVAPTMGNRMAGGTTSQLSPAGQGAPVGGGPNAGAVATSGGDQGEQIA